MGVAGIHVTENMSKYGSSYNEHGEATKEIIPSSTEIRRPITVSRVINLFLMLLYGVVVVLHIICLSVMAAKRNEIVGKFSDDPFYEYYNIKEGCMLFVDYDGLDQNGLPQINWVNNKCNVVIYGSAALGGCALVMMIFLMMRTMLCRK